MSAIKTYTEVKDECDLNAPIDGPEDERRLETSTILIRTQIGEAFYYCLENNRSHFVSPRGDGILSRIILYKLTTDIHETYFNSCAKYDQNRLKYRIDN